MSEIIYRKTTKDDMEILMKLRLEMLREVNDLTDEYEYDENFISESRKYFEAGEQTTVIALDGETPVQAYPIYGLCRHSRIRQAIGRI